ncbi:MAG: tyrosine-type recombinase/integrase [Eubacteriales bacterium]|nr:tyrosine-type recombinase/integrase [Eubacteriales bacterium]
MPHPLNERDYGVRCAGAGAVRAISSKYKRWLHRLNLLSYSFHALRHTFATRCIEKGFDPKSLSEILGHSDVKITLNRYVHPSIDLKRSHMERLTPLL